MSKHKSRTQLDFCENIEQSVSSVLNIREYLEQKEEVQIHRQFRSGSWKPNQQVLWSGMRREQAQIWADERDMQTLTTAMGPLMDTRIPSCPYNFKSPRAWSKFVHGASAVFAWHIAMGDVVTVLCPPPPQRFHPSGRSYFQIIEEPILKAAIADGAALRIELAHPRVKGAQEYRYQFWPDDEINTWVAVYGNIPNQSYVWRQVKGESPPAATKKDVEPQIVTSKNSSKPKKQPSTFKKENFECQQGSSKKPEKGVPNMTTMFMPALPNLATANIDTCPGKNSRLSKRERDALKAQEVTLKLQKVTTKAIGNGGQNIPADSSRHAKKSTAAVAAPAPKLTKAQKREAKKKAEEENQALRSPETLQRKEYANEPTLTKQTWSMMDDAIAAMELQYQLDFRPET